MKKQEKAVAAIEETKTTPTLEALLACGDCVVQNRTKWQVLDSLTRPEWRMFFDNTDKLADTVAEALAPYFADTVKGIVLLRGKGHEAIKAVYGAIIEKHLNNDAIKADCAPNTDRNPLREQFGYDLLYRFLEHLAGNIAGYFSLDDQDRFALWDDFDIKRPKDVNFFAPANAAND